MGLSIEETENEPGWILATRERRRIFAVVLTAVMLAITGWNLAPPGVRRVYMNASDETFQVTRLEQYWDFFAPEVGLVSTTAWVEIERDGGEIEKWSIGPSSSFMGSFRTSRWIKYREALYADQRLWQPAIDHVLARVDSPDTVVRASVIGAATAPTIGKSGPYDPSYSTRVLLSEDLADR